MHFSSQAADGQVHSPASGILAYLSTRIKSVLPMNISATQQSWARAGFLSVCVGGRWRCRPWSSGWECPPAPASRCIAS